LLFVYTTRARIRVRASRAAVYEALTSGDAVRQWRTPDDMTAEVHEFDAREGGAFRISLSYVQTVRPGKTEGHTDTFHGRFVRLVPGELVVEQVEFESPDPALAGVLTQTTTLTVAPGELGSTDVEWVQDGVPDAVPVADNETGARMALTNLARYVEGASGA
jgi:uncharacterized protein YndB with AHSA1/START domain